MLKRQLNSYKKTDKPTKHQPALPPEVYRQNLRSALNPRAKARAILLSSALFFCMRSCEYSKTSQKEQKTRTTRVKDITFRINGRILPHDHPRLHEATTVTITFSLQKCNVINEPVTQYRTDDPELCPVRGWSKVVSRIRSYPQFNEEWPVYTYYDGKNFSNITSTEILSDIRHIVNIMGPDVLGFTSADVGTHSNRGGGAMMMYLAKTPLVTIMMIGRWHSSAFLIYIEKQCLQFSQGVSQAMLKYNTFYNIPVRPWTSTDSEAHSRSADSFLSQYLQQSLQFGR